MKATIYLALSALLWGLNFHLLRVMLNSTGFLEAAFWRYIFGVVFLVLFTTRSLPAYSLVKGNLKGILLTGIAGIFFFNVLLFRGLEYTSALNASLLISLNPLITLFLSTVIFKTSIRFPQLTGAAFSMAGVMFLLSKGNFGQLLRLQLNTGDGLVLMASFLAAFYHIWVKKYAQNMENQHFTLLTNLVCMLCFILILPFLPASSPAAFGAGFWIAAVAFGSLGTALTYSLWNKGVKIAGAQKAGLFMNLVPLSTAGIAVILGESISTFHWVSGGFIVSGLFISQLSRETFSRIYSSLRA